MEKSGASPSRPHAYLTAVPNGAISTLLRANGADEKLLDKKGMTADDCFTARNREAVTGTLEGCVCHYFEGSSKPVSCADPRCVRTK